MPVALWYAISAQAPSNSGSDSRDATHAKHASWLNQAEIEIDIFVRQCLGARRMPSLPALRAECNAWNRRVNRQRLKIDWTFSRLDAANVFHHQLQLFKRSRH